MKLKKIAALALAGVLAVSMLAGCANKPGSSKPTTDETTDGLSASVIAALSEDTTEKVTFTVNSDLESAIESAVALNGTDNLSNIDLKGLAKFYSTLTTKDVTSAAGDTGLTNYNKVQKAEKEKNGAKVEVLAAGASAEYAAKQAAKKIDAAVKSFETEADYKYTDGNTQDEVTGTVTYTYNGTVAMVAVPSTLTGKVTYVVVYTVNTTGAAVND